VQDITKIKEFELSLLDAKQKAEAANKVKSEFLANVSHEIRTPLNSVIGFTNLLLDANLPELQKQYVHHTNTSAYSLLTMINDILDISKIEAGKMELEEIPFALDKLLEEAIDIVRFGAMEKKLDIKLLLPNPLPDLIYCDPIRLKQVLVNLLGNAVKFTEHGFVALRVDYELSEQNEEQLGCFTFSVSDSGIGISEQQKSKLFKSFSQADASTTRKFGGSGLGLAISNSLVAMMGGGHISIESILGEGSRFYFSITKKIAQKVAIESKDNSLKNNDLNHIVSNNPFHILVVDDVSLNLKLIRVLLQKMLPNAIVVEAKNGVASINLFRETDFNLIFMDIQMPEMDGYAAVKLIRMLEQEHKKIPIVAITAGIVAGEKERCFAVGMNDYLTKPIIMGELKMVLDKYLKN
jgi:CheY-like chemotaxis protein